MNQRKIKALIKQWDAEETYLRDEAHKRKAQGQPWEITMTTANQLWVCCRRLKEAAGLIKTSQPK
jgi:hypothetical protein